MPTFRCSDAISRNPLTAESFDTPTPFWCERVVRPPVGTVYTGMTGRKMCRSHSAKLLLAVADRMVVTGRSFTFSAVVRADGGLTFEMRTALEKGRASIERWHLRNEGVRFRPQVQ